MKLSKFWISLGVLSTFSCSIVLNSCNKYYDDQTENKYTDYIKDRTFTISGGGACGTAWILSDSTPSVKTDYNYWIATNMHVVRAMTALGYKTINKLSYADESMAENGYINSYKPFASFDSQSFHAIDHDTNYLYDKDQSQSFLMKAIDLAIFKVDFGAPEGAIKTKLDKLNKLDKINSFKTINDDSDVHSKGKHLGGYPVKYNGQTRLGCKWECHNIPAKDLAYCTINTKYHNDQVGHPIGYPNLDQQGNPISEGLEPYYWYDVSPQYLSNVTRPLDYMEAGSSGSMLIDDDFNTIGIYWGGWGTKDNRFLPSFTLFNTQYCNFIERIVK